MENPICISKKEKQKLFFELCKQGPKIIIDCDYEDLMIEKEIKSLTQQLTYCVNSNKKMEIPMNLIFTGLGPGAHAALGKMDYHNWQIQTFLKTEEARNSYLDITENCLPSGYKKEQLVYLTADSPNDIKQLDINDIYIIGGIVDRNRYKSLTIDKAEKEGIRHGRLPIVDHVKLESSCVLTVNHVFEIMAEQFNSNDWQHTLDKVIPDRKKDGWKSNKEKNKEKSQA